MRKAVVAGVGVIVVVLGLSGTVYAATRTPPIKVETSSGPVYLCPPGTTLKWWFGVPYCE